MHLLFSQGQEHDAPYAIPLLSEVEFEGSNVLGDKAFDSDEIINYIYKNGGEPVIPTKSNRKIQREIDKHLYKERHVVECFFQKLKQFRRIATRYDKYSFTFAGFACVASINI